MRQNNEVGRAFAKTAPVFILWLLCIPLFFTGIYSIHVWGDDFSQYIKEGLNIAQGRPWYQSGYVFNEADTIFAPPQYPVGYPLILAPFLKIFGLKIRPLLYLNTVLVIALASLAYGFFKRYMKPAFACCLALLIAYNGNLIELKTQVLSDLPAAVICTAYLLIRKDGSLTHLRCVLLVILALAMILVRSQMIVIVAAEALLLSIDIIRYRKRVRMFRSKDRTVYAPLLVIIMTLLLYMALQKTILKTPVSSDQFYMQLMHFSEMRHTVNANLQYYFEQFRLIFYYSVGEPAGTVLIGILQSAAVCLFIIGFVSSARQQFRFHHAFFIAFFFVVLALPVHQGFRYILPVVPLVYLYCFLGLRNLNRHFLHITFKYKGIAITALILLLGIDTYGRFTRPLHEDNPYTPADQEAFAYLRKNVPDTSLILFFKPRALTLFTGRKAMILSTTAGPEENLKTARNKGAAFVLVREGLEPERYRAFVWDNKLVADSTTINSQYTIYRLVYGY